MTRIDCLKEELELEEQRVPMVRELISIDTRLLKLRRNARLKEIPALEEQRAPLSRLLLAIEARLLELRRNTPPKSRPHCNIKRPRCAPAP